MIYSNNDMLWWVPCAKNMNSLFFASILMKHENAKKKLYYLIIKTNDKKKSTKWKIQRRSFQARIQSQMAFQDGGLKVSFHGLSVSARIYCRFGGELCTI